MARIPSATIEATIDFPNRPGGQQNGGIRGGSSSTSSSSSRDSISQRVINSPAYRSAFEVLSQESDKSWLQRLEMIPYSVINAAGTISDSLGFTSNFDDKQAANYQYCLQQISALMQEYYSWKNSLPTTQVQQLSDAGINSAITGQGVSGSSIPNVGVGSDPSVLRSADPISVFGSALGTAVDFIMTPVNGFADLAAKFKQLRLTDRSQTFNEQSALLDFYKYATENGYVIGKDVLNGTFGDLFKFDYFENPKGERISSEEVLKGYLSHHVNAPLYAGLAALYPTMVGRFKYDGVDSWYTHTGFAPVSVGLSEVVDAQLSMYRNEERYRLALQQYQSITAQHGADSAEYNAAAAQYNKDYQGYLKEKQRITQDLINKLAASNNEDDKLLLSKILLGYNYDDIDILNAQADFAEVRQTTGALGDVVGGSFGLTKVVK